MGEIRPSFVTASSEGAYTVYLSAYVFTEAPIARRFAADMVFLEKARVAPSAIMFRTVLPGSSTTQTTNISPGLLLVAFSDGSARCFRALTSAVKDMTAAARVKGRGACPDVHQRKRGQQAHGSQKNRSDD